MAQFERRYIAEYVLARWPEGGYQLGVSLGALPENMVKSLGYDAASKLYRPFRPEVDAVKFFPTGLILIEGKVFDIATAIAKLRWYGTLVPLTEELRSWWGMPVTLRVATPRRFPLLEQMAKDSGVELDLFVTEAVLAHAAKYERYWTAPYRQQREAKMQRRRELGLD